LPAFCRLPWVQIGWTRKRPAGVRHDESSSCMTWLRTGADGFRLVLALGPCAGSGGAIGAPARQRRLQALCVLTLFLTFDLVLFGAFTRLTDSGLGCPDWPGCYGTASPIAGTCPDLRSASCHADRPGHPWQGLGGNDSPLSGDHGRRAHHCHDGHELEAGTGSASAGKPTFQWRCQPLVADSGSGMGLHTGRFGRLDGHHESCFRPSSPAAGRYRLAGIAGHSCIGPEPAAGRPLLRPDRQTLAHCGCAWRCSSSRSAWAAGSAPITPCWPARPSPAVRAAGGQP
jgi:hypothetical protein